MTSALRVEDYDFQRGDNTVYRYGIFTWTLCQRSDFITARLGILKAVDSFRLLQTLLRQFQGINALKNISIQLNAPVFITLISNKGVYLNTKHIVQYKCQTQGRQPMQYDKWLYCIALATVCSGYYFYTVPFTWVLCIE